jgi:hypothetical protein
MYLTSPSRYVHPNLWGEYHYPFLSFPLNPPL